MPYAYEDSDPSADRLLERLRGMIAEARELRDEMETLREENKRLRDAIFGVDFTFAERETASRLEVLELNPGQLWLP